MQDDLQCRRICTALLTEWLKTGWPKTEWLRRKTLVSKYLRPSRAYQAPFTMQIYWKFIGEFYQWRTETIIENSDFSSAENFHSTTLVWDSWSHKYVCVSEDHSKLWQSGWPSNEEWHWTPFSMIHYSRKPSYSCHICRTHRVPT